MTYPWPNVSLVALREKQENNNCQHLLATSNTHRREAVTDRLKNWYLCIRRKDSKVIRPQSSSGCRHLLYKSFDRPQLESSDTARWALGFFSSLMRIWCSCSCHRATSMITWQELNFQTSASAVFCNPRSSVWFLLWQRLFTVTALFLWFRLSGQFSLKCKKKKKKKRYTHIVTDQCTNGHTHEPPLPTPAALTVWSLTFKAGQRFTERENIWLSSSPAEGL